MARKSHTPRKADYDMMRETQVEPDALPTPQQAERFRTASIQRNDPLVEHLQGIQDTTPSRKHKSMSVRRFGKSY